MTGIQQMFHELMGYEEYQQDLFSWAMRKRHAADQWRRDNPERAREHARRSMAKRYATDEVFRARKKADASKRQKTRYATDPAFRERMKAHARAAHARRKAA